MIPESDVVCLFRSLFNREPDAGAITSFSQSYSSFESLRDALLYSEEFFLLMKDRLTDFSATYKACDYPPRHYYPSAKRATLGLACIAKNEASTIGRMIDSCLPIVDFIAVLDTGSEDNTIETASTAAIGIEAEIVSQIFEPFDFAQARNAAVDILRGKTDWVLMLDADEYLVPEDYANLISMISTDHGIDGWRLPRYNFLDEDLVQKPHMYPDYQKRLFRNRTDIHFAGRVHEWLVNVRKWGFAPTSEIACGGSCGGPHIHHTGLVNIHLNEEKARTKYEFYKSLGAPV